MRFVVLLACLAVACGGTDDEEEQPRVITAVETGDIFTCAIQTVGASAPDAGASDAGTDAGMDDAGLDAGDDAGMDDSGVDMDVGMTDVGMPDVGTPDAGSLDAGGPDAGGVDDGELDPVIRPTCWIVEGVPQPLNLGRTLRGRVFLGDPLCNLADGQLFCLGNNEHGQVGNGTEDAVIDLTQILTPRRLTDLAVSRFGGGRAFTCGLGEDGSVYCWGFGEDGQLGVGSFMNQSSPVFVGGVTGGYLLTTGSGHACVATANEETGAKAIRCWGIGSDGQLGDGTTNNSATPVTVNLTRPDDEPSLEDPVQLVAGGFHTCALDLDGEVWCWGRGDLGQMGNGGTIGQMRPTRVSFASLVEEGEPEPTATQIAGGGWHNCALLTGGQVACWGGNEFFQAGVAAGTMVLSPRSVIDAGASFVVAGRSHSCAIVDNLVQCWGQGIYLAGAGGGVDTARPVTVRF